MAAISNASACRLAGIRAERHSEAVGVPVRSQVVQEACGKIVEPYTFDLANEVFLHTEHPIRPVNNVLLAIYNLAPGSLHYLTLNSHSNCQTLRSTCNP